MWGGEGSCGEKPTCCCYFKCCFKLTLYKDSFGKVVVGGGGGGELRRKEVDWRQLYKPGAKEQRGKRGEEERYKRLPLLEPFVIYSHVESYNTCSALTLQKTRGFLKVTCGLTDRPVVGLGEASMRTRFGFSSTN